MWKPANQPQTPSRPGAPESERPAKSFNAPFKLSILPLRHHRVDRNRQSDLTFQICYAANVTLGDSVINITNTGSHGAAPNGPGIGGPVGNLCINADAFSPEEQLIACCSCLVTPNGLVSLSVVHALIYKTLTGIRPNSVVVKLISTASGANYTGNSCSNSSAFGWIKRFSGFYRHACLGHNRS